MTKLSYWIKERHNPQLGVYYVPCGQLSVKEARAKENPLYGSNHMHRFQSLEAYEQKLDELRKSGASIR